MKCLSCKFDISFFRWLFKSRVCWECGIYLDKYIAEEKIKRFMKWKEKELKKLGLEKSNG